MAYVAANDRYERIAYRRCGRSGLKLPPISLGLWQNFGGVDVFETGRAILRRAFDRLLQYHGYRDHDEQPDGGARHVARRDARLAARQLDRPRTRAGALVAAGLERVTPGHFHRRHPLRHAFGA